MSVRPAAYVESGFSRNVLVGASLRLVGASAILVGAMRRTRVGASLLVIRLLAATVGAQDADPVSALVARAGRYVQEYEKQFSAVVCQEQQTQRIVRSDGSEKKRRALVSDLLLVKAGDRTIGFRDVISVDGKAVRDREERLRKLFIDEPRTAMRQARVIAEESARYNIGFERTIDALMVPLEILQPRSAPGFRFEAFDDGLAFEEFQSPSLIRYRTGGGVHDMLLRGRFVLDRDNGQMRSASLRAGNATFETTFDVRYVEDPALGLLVPAAMQERYNRTGKPKEDHLEVSSSYSNFRRFQVIVDERIDGPK